MENVKSFLAGTILALSALRVGSRVKVVLSGEPGRFHSTEGFIAQEDEILKVLTGYLGTGNSFGIHRLADTFLAQDQSVGKTLILVISDSDIFNALGKVQDGLSGWSVAKDSATKAGGGATYALHMPESYFPEGVERMRRDLWNVFSLVTQEDLVHFARNFSRQHYGRFFR